MTTYGSDTFIRPNTNNGTWGTATDGETWQHLLGSATTCSVTGNEGVITSTPGTWDSFRLGTTSVSGTLEVTTHIIADDPSSNFGTLLYMSSNGQVSYMVIYDGVDSNGFTLQYNNSGPTLLAKASYTATAGKGYYVKGRISSGVLYGKIWADTASEPGSWMLTANTTTITSGGYGVLGAASNNLKFDHFTATDGTTTSLTSISVTEQGPTLGEMVNMLTALTVTENVVSESEVISTFTTLTLSEQLPTSSEAISALTVLPINAVTTNEQAPTASEQVRVIQYAINALSVVEQAPTSSEQISIVAYTFTQENIIEQTPTALETAIAVAITVSDPSVQMTTTDLAMQYARIKASSVYSRINFIATTYYGNVADKSQQGELDVALKNETVSQMHVLRTINDTTTFLRSYAYMSALLQDSPVAYYRLGDRATGTARDLSGNGYDANVIGGVTVGQAGAIAGDPNASMLFDGSTGYIALPAGMNTTGWSQYTIEVWVWLSSTTFSGLAGLVGNDNPGQSNDGIYLGINNNAFSLANGYGAASSGLLTSSYSWGQHTWYHLAAIYDTANLSLYINGVLTAQSASTGAIAAAAYPLNLARNPALAANYFPGCLDEVALYPYALSASRLLYHYQVAQGLLT